MATIQGFGNGQIATNQLVAPTGTLTAQECVLCAWWTSDPHTETAPTASSTSLSPTSGTGISRSSTASGSRA